MRNLFSQITGIQTNRVNQDAVAMVEDLDNALQDAHSGEVAFGNHTSTVVLRHSNPQFLEEAAREVVKVFERAGCNARLESINNFEAFLGSLPGHGKENVRKPLITTFNFADLVPLSNDWIGDKFCPCPFYPPNSPALLQAATAGSTPFSLNLHSGDVGHTLILGHTGAGKSTLLATVAAQFQRYNAGQIFFFDNGKSIYPLCQALDDSVFYDLGQAALGFYSLNQSGGYLLEGDHDDINYASFNIFEIAAFLERKKIASAVLTYLFFQIQRRLKSAPSLLVVDEAWTAMRDKLFSEKIRGWLKTFRKLNCAVVLATQSIVDVVNSTIRDAVFESCST